MQAALQTTPPRHVWPLRPSTPPGADLYRACTVCDHGRLSEQRAHRCALLAPVLLSVEEARAITGPCGRDAAHLRVGGWDLKA